MSNVPNWHDLLENAHLTSARANSLIWGSEHSFMDDDDRSTTTSRQTSVVSFPPSRLSSVSVLGPVGRPPFIPRVVGLGRGSLPSSTIPRETQSPTEWTTPRLQSFLNNPTVVRERRSPTRRLSIDSTSSIESTIHVRLLQAEAPASITPAQDQEAQAGNRQSSIEPEKQGTEAAADTSTPANNSHSKATTSTPQRRSDEAQGTESHGQPTTRRRSERQRRIRETTNPRSDGLETVEDAESSAGESLIGDDNTSDVDPDYGAKPKNGRKTGADRRASPRKSTGRKK